VPAELGRYLTGRLWPGDAALGERPVTGVFDLRDIRQAVRRAVAPHGGPVQQLTPDPLPVRAA
jgi:transmembrane sensor